MTDIPDSSDLPNMHDPLGLNRSAQFLLTKATKDAIEQLGYHIHGEKGRGGFGATFEVRQRESNARFIIKVMLDPTNEQHLKAFRRECRVLASEHVPSDVVPTYITHREERGVQPFVVMEYIDGAEIQNYVSKPHQLDLDRRIEIVEKLFRGLQKLHDCNIVHGDPSPRNVLMQSGDRVRWIDYGSACRLNQGWGTLGTVSLKGVTPGYGDDDILINGKRPDRWTDLFAVAGVAFLALTNQAPPAYEAAWERILSESGVPSGVRNVLLKARRKRDDRYKVDQVDPAVYKTAGDAADAIQLWRKNRDQTAVWWKHVRWGAAAVSIALLIAGWGWWLYSQERQLGDARTLADLRRQVESLPNASHPGIVRLMEATSGNDVPVKRQIELLTKARTSSVEIEWAEKIGESLGNVLNDSPWLSVKAVQRSKDSLATRFRNLRADLAAGQTDDLQPRFAEWHRDLAQLAKDNTEARPAEERRIEFDRLVNSVAPALREKDGYVQIARSAREDAQRLLDDGQWHLAGLQFGSCFDALTKWLKLNETPEQLAARQKGDRETLAAVEREKEELKSEVKRVEALVKEKIADITSLNGQIAVLTAERLKDGKKLDEAITKLGAEQTLRQAAEGTVAVLEPKFTLLEAANKKLAADSKELTELKPKFAATEKELKATTGDLTASRQENEQLRALLKNGDPDAARKAAEIAKTTEALGNVDTHDSVSKAMRIKMARIPAGTFQMGSPDKEEDHQKNEGPQHPVQMSAFDMSVYPVTQEQFEKAMGSNPSWFSKTGGGSAKVQGMDTSQFPVEMTSFFDGIEFCIKASEKDGYTPRYQLTNIQRNSGSIKSADVKEITGTGYRLPTEAQFEYAARATTTTPFFFGTTLNGDKANIDGNYPYGTTTKGKYLERTTKVGSYPENKFGLFDMSGNVWQWCYDVYDEDAYSGRKGTTKDPVVTSGSNYRVVRAGSWFYDARNARSAYRNWFSPDYHNFNFGFRVVR